MFGRLRILAPLLFVICCTVFFVGGNSPTRSVFAEDATICTTHPNRYLSGELTEINLGVVTNNSQECLYTIGIASYMRFGIDNDFQQIFDWNTITVEPGTTVEIGVEIPDCGVQVFLFYGPVLFSLDEENYAGRRLATKQENGTGPCELIPPDCAIYSVAQQNKINPPYHRLASDRSGHQRVDVGGQLLAIELRSQTTYSVGDLRRGADISGLAFGPNNDFLYAISGDDSDYSGNLYLVDRQSAELTIIGNTGFDSLNGLASHPLDGTLWSWDRRAGLIKIDATNGTSSIEFDTQRNVKDLAWSPDGSILYVLQGNNLWAYDPLAKSLERLTSNLPRNTQAIEIRPDGLLLGSALHANDDFFFIFNLSTQQTVEEKPIDNGGGHIRAITWPAICGNPSPGGEAEIIEEVVLEKAEICAGESFLVSVTAEHPELPTKPVDIAINGKMGSSRYLQFTGQPGIRLIQVTAATLEQHIDIWEGQVEVIACDESQVFPVVSARINPFQDLIVDLDILNAAEFEPDSPTYVWEFGDGQVVETTVPFVSHDYGEAVDTEQLYTVFQARLTVQRDNQPEVSTNKTLTVWSQYAYNKGRGIIQPRVTHEPQLIQEGENYVGVFTVENYEDESIQLTSRLIEFQMCDPAQDAALLEPEDHLLELEGNQEITEQFTISVDDVPNEACGVNVHWTGQTSGQIDAYVSLYFDTKENPTMNQPIVDPAMVALLNDIVERGLVTDPHLIADEDLYRLAREGEIVYPPLPLESRPEDTANQYTLPSMLDDDVIGQPCFSDEEPPRPGVTCQATGEWVFAQPHIRNALKGDVILSAGCGLIGDLLRQVSPAQKYTHSGIMTQNYYQLRHSTAIPARYEDYPVGEFLGFEEPFDGFRKDVMLYGAPGTVTQSINEAFNGASWVDPESGERYEFEGFSANPARCGEDTEITYPLVVKPPPGHDQAIRNVLRSAADAALEINGHYRFFAYTEGGISEDHNFDAPVDSGWANGTVATVCTTFIWSALRSVGINLEGPQLEIEDVKNGADVDLATLDGLYLYTETERKVAGEWLFNHVSDQAVDEGGFFGWLSEPFTDLVDDVANQITNCFANDSCDPQSEAWKEPGVGRAVSPDNILFWDAPETGGVYGYSENLVYRQGGRMAVTTWQPSEGVGTLKGQVLSNGVPVENATITILGLELFTDMNGQFQDDLIPAGTYEVVAFKMIDDWLYSTEEIVEIQPNLTTEITLNLEIPRLIVFDGYLEVHDEETIGGSTKTVLAFDSVLLSPSAPITTIQFEGCNDDEVGGIIELHLTLLEYDTISILAVTKLYDDDGPGGFSCFEADDLEAIQTNNFIVYPGSNTINIPRLEDDGDWVEATFSIENIQQP